jgi:hypothetical protein
VAYVPWVPPTPRRPVSPRANELANKIGALIKDYRGYYPELSDRDVREALRAAGADGAEPQRIRPRALVAALGAVLAVGAVVAVRFSGAVDPSRFVAPVAGAVALLAVLFARLRRER